MAAPGPAAGGGAAAPPHSASAAAPPLPAARMLGESGVSLRLLSPGDGVHFPRKGTQVRLHYEARLVAAAGVLAPPFDSSRVRDAPVVVRVGAGALVSGLETALLAIPRGARAEVTVPPAKAYGARGYPPIVPPDAVIVYDVEVLAIG
jgi:FK506-binding protein 1